MRFALAAIAALSLTAVACSTAEEDSSGSGANAVTSCQTNAPLAPRMCPEIFQPVCGCDGKTYGNDCEAEAYVGSWSEGACPTSTVDAGGAGNTCKVSPPKAPAFCAEIFQPVCGCDGKTYGNDCEAGGSVTSWTDGACN